MPLITINMFTYVGVSIGQITISNIGMMLVLFVGITYCFTVEVDKIVKLFLLYFLLISIGLFNTLMSFENNFVISRAWISAIYYLVIATIMISTYYIVRFFYLRGKLCVLFNHLRMMGITSLFLFGIVTIYKKFTGSTLSILTTDPTYGYRDYGNPLVDGVHFMASRSVGTFPEPSMYAGFIVIILPFLVGYKNNTITNILLLFLTILSISMTYSRIGFILLGVYIVIKIFTTNNKKKYLIGIVSIAILCYFIDMLLGGVYIKTNIVRLTNLTEYIDVSILTRIFTPIQFFTNVDSKIIFGYGIASVVGLIPRLGMDDSYLQFNIPTLNNLYLNIIAEFGILVFCFLLFYMFNFFVDLVKNNIHKKYSFVFESYILLLAYFFSISHLILYYLFYLLFTLHYILYFLLKKEKYC